MAWLHNAMARSRSVSCHLRVQKAPFTVPSRAGLGGAVLFLFTINYSLCSLSLPRDPFFFFWEKSIIPMMDWGQELNLSSFYVTLENGCGLNNRVLLGTNVP